jgi:hypothetical protein
MVYRLLYAFISPPQLIVEAQYFLGPFIVKFPFPYTRVLHEMFIVFKSDYSEIVQSIAKFLILKYYCTFTE